MGGAGNIARVMAAMTAEMEAQGIPGQELYDLVLSTLAEAKGSGS